MDGMTGIKVWVVGGELPCGVRVEIIGRMGEKAKVAPIDPTVWDACKKHLLDTARGCFAGDQGNGMLTSTTDSAGLLKILYIRGIVVL